jgi:hypothetical protein
MVTRDITTRVPITVIRVAMITEEVLGYYHDGSVTRLLGL